MANLAQWIEEAAGDEDIEAIVFGGMGWDDYRSVKIPKYKECPKNAVLTWAFGREFADYDFDAGYGAPGCQAITAWTKSKVIFVSQYDGATGIETVPRNPIDHEPTMPGG